ncbi:MAG TPA: hypothetical protein VID73_12560 [Ktedonobacterales bacterium]|jgi:hypothetical protein
MLPETTASSQRRELARDVRATLAARDELGAATGGVYDDQFIEALVERLLAQARREMATAPRQRTGLTPDQRTGLGIVSVVMLIPLIAIAGAMFGTAGFLVICALVLGINVLALF